MIELRPNVLTAIGPGGTTAAVRVQATVPECSSEKLTFEHARFEPPEHLSIWTLLQHAEVLPQLPCSAACENLTSDLVQSRGVCGGSVQLPAYAGPLKWTECFLQLVARVKASDTTCVCFVPLPPTALQLTEAEECLKEHKSEIETLFRNTNNKLLLQVDSKRRYTVLKADGIIDYDQGHTLRDAFCTSARRLGAIVCHTTVQEAFKFLYGRASPISPAHPECFIPLHEFPWDYVNEVVGLHAPKATDVVYSRSNKGFTFRAPPGDVTLLFVFRLNRTVTSLSYCTATGKEIECVMRFLEISDATVDYAEVGAVWFPFSFVELNGDIFTKELHGLAVQKERVLAKRLGISVYKHQAVSLANGTTPPIARQASVGAPAHLR